MQKVLGILIISVLVGCSSPTPQPTILDTEDYELHLTGDPTSTLLIIFPGLGQIVEQVKESFEILDLAAKQNISVLMMEFNHRLHLDPKDEESLNSLLEKVVSENKLTPEEIVIGGFSSGGIISVLWGNVLIADNHPSQPDQIFVIDSPLDLKELYIHVVNIDSTAHALSKEESIFLTDYFAKVFPESVDVLEDIPSISPYDFASGSLKDISNLKDIPVRVYTEPDSTWWRVNRGFEFEATNGFQLTRFAEFAQSEGWDKLELIQTKNKGYRPNGDRHPHSWSIVDVAEILEWIEKK
ncbi:MAG: hypothetical protein AAGC47_07625 [Bacteroidota bacterium]